MFAGNVGSVARAMMNFGLSQMRLVHPACDYLGPEGRKMAVNALPLLQNAKVYDTVGDAIADSSIVVGTSSGRQRDLSIIPLRNLVFDLQCKLNGEEEKTIAALTIAWLFGNEQNGLEREDLARCHYIVSVPTHESFPALNLAQAACLTAYEISASQSLQSINKNAPVKDDDLKGQGSTDETLFPQGKEDDELINLVGDWLDAVEFSRTFNRHKVLRELRQLYQRTLPTRREASLIKGIMLRTLQKIRAANISP
jgi:TrmH family RNA methyltransferase